MKGGIRNVVVRSMLILTLTPCETLDNKGNRGIKADNNAKLGRKLKFGANTFEHDIKSNRVPETRYRGTRHRDHHRILTPYITNNRIKEGVKAAKVTPPLMKNIRSFSGFFEVDEAHQSHMFFLLFPCLRKLPIRKRKIPVLLWLQGGLGSSSLHSAFRGNGPIRIENGGTLTYNNYSWAEKAHLVYFDNPVGAGYSYTLKRGFSKNMSEVANNLYAALKQFITLFKLDKNPLYIGGQGFGGKYVTSLGAMIHRRRKLNKMNFKGVVIGNGFIDPPNMLRFGAYMYQLGFIDSRVRDKFGAVRRRITEHLRNGNDTEAVELYEQWVRADSGEGAIPQIRYITGLPTLLNYEITRETVDEGKLLNRYFNNESIMASLNTGVGYTTHNTRCRRALRSVMLQSEVGHLKLLMNKYRVILYHGQMSIKSAYPFMLNYLRKIEWKGKENYKKRLPWSVDGEVAGYYKTGGSFTELLIRNAGQMVSMDQPKWAQRMINNFLYKLPLNNDHD